MSFVDKKVKIESPCCYNLDENLKNYLGFKDIEFIRTSNKRVIYYPTSDEYYINIEQECEFTIEKKIYKMPFGIYSINEIQNVLNPDKNVCNIKLALINNLLKISTNYEYIFDDYLTERLGVPLFDFITDYKTEYPFKKSVTGTRAPKFYTQSFLKDINGIIETENAKTEITKQNYTIDRLNKLLPSSIKIQQTNNYITITSKDYYLLDENLRLSLGYDNKYTYKHIGSDIILGQYLVNKLLEIHCDIIEKSISNHKTEQYLHRDDDILSVIKCDMEGQYITNDIKYIPLNVIDFKYIKLFISDQDGNEINNNGFVAYLILKS
uniref:Uncharacterized protein n=1 Tax=Schizaphis graminum TaxID=13262 RepID=A0A2S2P8F5_SCHGA